MNRVKDALDAKLVIQLLGLFFFAAMGWATMKLHIDESDIHMDYAELTTKMVPREIFNIEMGNMKKEMVSMNVKLDRIESLLLKRE